jgi:hypothetical protein
MTQKSDAYYTLLIRAADDHCWGIAFGSHDRDDVDAEAEEYADDGDDTFILITASDDQRAIDDRVNELNEACSQQR